ncbi:MAG TPA: hypothetical protein PLW65_30275 [Pseudomonadota bacterium]|nr:hypothetical protein [Pseudomonadota bacterium]
MSPNHADVKRRSARISGAPAPLGRQVSPRRRSGFLLTMVLLGACTSADSGAPDALAPDAAAVDLSPAGCQPVMPAQSTGCAAWSGQPAAGKLPSSALNEVSGLVVSRKNSTATTTVLWLHNDSGDTARVFAVALDSAGPPRLVATYTLSGVTAEDWEDLALGPVPGRSGDFLYLGDTGNNFNRVPRRTSLQIYRIPEPPVDLTKTDQKLAVADAERLELVYPEGKVFDCESVLVDPHSGELVLITKDIFAGPSYVFRTPAVTAPLGTITLTQVTDCQGGPTALHFPAGELPAMTGADITAAGDAIIGRAYSGIFLWNRLPGESIGAALGRQPCALPAASEKQGEAVGFARDGATYYTVSEGAGAEINVFRRN